MKITTPKDATEYFRKTEHAVRHFYSGLDSCWSYYREAVQHWDIRKIDQPMTLEQRAGLERYLQLAGNYCDQKISEATFAGSILQVAYMAIRLYSCNDTIPPQLYHPGSFLRQAGHTVLHRPGTPHCANRPHHLCREESVQPLGRRQPTRSQPKRLRRAVGCFSGQYVCRSGVFTGKPVDQRLCG